VSIKVTAFRNPFDVKKVVEDVEFKDGMTVADLIKQYRHPSQMVTMRALVNGIPVKAGERIHDGDEVILRSVPRGETTKDTGDKVTGWSWVAVALGVILAVFNPVLGGILIGVGVAGFVTGATITLYGALGFAADTSTPDNVYSIRGATNKTTRWGKIPIVIGKHLMAPPYAANGYTEIGGTDGVDQYVRLLYVLGYSELSVKNIKFGDQLVATNAADVRNGAIDCTTGLYSGIVEAEIRQDRVSGTAPTLYPYTMCEENINAELKSTETIQRLTGKNVGYISVDVCFDRGLFAYNSDGALVNATVQLAAEYRLEGDASWLTIGTFDGATSTITRARRELMRFTASKNVTPDPDKGWEVRVRRITEAPSDSNTMDSVRWTAFRYCNADSPVSESARKKICLLALRVKATEALNGILDQVNVEAQMVAPDYDGSGSGSSNWVEGITSNPASAFLHVLRSSVSARPRTDAEIDWAALEAWHTWCETEGFECNAVIQGSTRIVDILRTICSSARASLTKKDGLISVVQDIERTTVVQHITPRNSKNYTIAKKFTERPHALRIAFINAAQGWAADECIVYDDGYTAANATIFKKIDLWGLTDYDHVWRQGRYMIACNKLRPETHTVEMDFEGLVCTRGDLVKVLHDVPMWGLAAGRVSGVTLNVDDDLLAITVDNDCPMEAGKDYRVTIRLATGEAPVVADVTTVAGNNRTLTFDIPISPGLGQPAIGDLFMFGEVGYENVDCIVIGMEILDDLRVRLTMMEHAPAVFTADTGSIPAFESKISKVPKFAPATVVPSVPQVSPPSALPPPTLVVAEDHTTVTPVYDGLLCQETTTNSLWRYDGATEAWVYVMLAHEASIRMTASSNRLLRARSGDLSPNALTLTAYYSDNNDSYSGRFVIEVTTDGTTYHAIYASDADEYSHAETDIASTYEGSNITLIRCRLYKAGGTTILYEQQIVGVSADPSAAPLYWGPLSTAPTGEIQPDDHYFDTNTIAEGGGVMRYFTGSAWAEMTSAHPLWKTVWGNVYILTDAAEWASAQGTVVAAANAIFEKLYATSIISAYIFAQQLTLTGGARVYDGQGVQRRCIEIKAGRIDFIDAPDTSPASDEVLRGRFGRLGVGETILVDGDFRAPISGIGAAETELGVTIGYTIAQTELASGEKRIAYRRTSDGHVVERRDTGTGWGAEIDVSDASAYFPAYCPMSDGSVYIGYRLNGSKYIVERLDSGSGYGDEAPVVEADSAYPAYLQTADGARRIAYRGTATLRTEREGLLTKEQQPVICMKKQMMELAGRRPPRWYRRLRYSLHISGGKTEKLGSAIRKACKSGGKP